MASSWYGSDQTLLLDQPPNHFLRNPHALPDEEGLDPSVAKYCTDRVDQRLATASLSRLPIDYSGLALS
jgi:hypothetical protein